MDNYQYVARFVTRERAGRSDFKTLDYGCGAGDIVRRLRAEGVDAYGCDVFYAGGDRSKLVPKELMNRVILPMESGMIPFPDGTFDFVTSNQVLEHVPDLPQVVSEMARVLKPGGTVLNLFPDASVWREGHCEIPFLHWFPKRSTPRIYYAFLLRCLGMGKFTDGKSRFEWAKNFCNYLDQWTYYRSYSEIARDFGHSFEPLQHFEADWISSRWPKLGKLPASVQSFIARKWGSRVFTCRKPLA